MVHHMTFQTFPSLYGDLDAPDWANDLILRSLKTLGEWAEVEAQLLARAVPEQARFWDVGAFLGTMSLGVARHRALASVLAVEVNPALGASLTRNLARNLAAPAHVVNAGVGKTDGWLVAMDQPDAAANHGGQSYQFSARPPTGSSGMGVACKSLRQLRAAYGDYDAMKLDVEGMERDVLLGDQDYIRAHHPLIWVECNEALSSLDLHSALIWLGYAPLYLAFPAFRKNNHFGATDLIYPMAYEAALLAARPEQIATFSAAIEGEDIICRPVNTSFDLRRALYDTPRWGRPEWAVMSRAELIARMGRVAQGSQLPAFLQRDAAPDTPAS